jgi:hypothetical protein
VNLHGGSSAFLTAGLGDHTPGMEVAKTPQTVRSGFYTPIQSEPGREVKAMPIFYGMLLANQFAGDEMLKVQVNMQGVNAKAFAARHNRELKVAIFNKDESRGIDLSIVAPRRIRAASAWRMQASALDATEGVTLGGAEIEAHAQWSLKIAERIMAPQGVPRMRVPAGSAALVFLS